MAGGEVALAVSADLLDISLRLSRRDVAMLLASLSAQHEEWEDMKEDDDMASRLLVEAAEEMEARVRQQLIEALGEGHVEDLEAAVDQMYSTATDAVLKKWEKGEFP
jgi:hypothetical protein